MIFPHFPYISLKETWLIFPKENTGVNTAHPQYLLLFLCGKVNCLIGLSIKYLESIGLSAVAENVCFKTRHRVHHVAL